MAEPSLLLLPLDCLLQVLANVSVTDILCLGCSCKSLREVIKDDKLWRTLAERKWGHLAVELPTVEPGQWQAFCRHRLTFVSLPPSPLDLLQERYPDPWQHLASCILCSRTTGGPAVRQGIATLLLQLPTPSALLGASKGRFMELLHPMGLQATRYAALCAMSRDFLEKDWQDPQEFKGCGKFVSDSWRIFCRGCRSSKGVGDATLLRFLRWLVKGTVEERRPQKKAAATGGTGGGRKRKGRQGSEGEAGAGVGGRGGGRSRRERRGQESEGEAGAGVGGRGGGRSRRERRGQESEGEAGAGGAQRRLRSSRQAPEGADRRITRSATKARQ